MRRQAVWAFVAAVALTGCARPDATPFVADSVEVDVRVLPSGAAEIRERIAGRVLQDSTAFARDVAYSRADALRFVAASLDGRELERDEPGEPSVIVQEGRRLAVRWNIRAASQSVHVFELVYIADGAVRLEGARGSLRLPVIQSARSFPAGAARVSLALPEGARMFEGSGIAEAGWTVARQPSGIAGERKDLAAADGGTLVAEFSVDPALAREPAWQAYERSRQFLLPAFVSGAVFMLVIGAGVLWIVRFRYPRSHAATPEDERERQIVRAGLRNGGLVTIVVGLLTAGVALAALDRFGLPSMALPASIVVIGIAFLAVSKRWV